MGLLWNSDGKPKPESAVQLLFQGLAKAQCRANDVEVDREVELGPRPRGLQVLERTKHRALLEVKKLHSGSSGRARGPTSQLQQSDGSKDAWYLAVHYLTHGVSEKRIRLLPTRIAELSASSGLRLRYAYVDARPKLSASLLSAEAAAAEAEEDAEEAEEA